MSFQPQKFPTQDFETCFIINAAAKEERDFAAPQYEYHGNFSAGEEGCIKDHNKIKKKGISSLDDCKEACDDYSWCLSIEYNSNTKVCHLSEDTKNSVSSENWNSPCDDPHQDVMYYEWQQGHNNGSTPSDLGKN